MANKINKNRKSINFEGDFFYTRRFFKPMLQKREFNFDFKVYFLHKKHEFFCAETEKNKPARLNTHLRKISNITDYT